MKKIYYKQIGKIKLLFLGNGEYMGMGEYNETICNHYHSYIEYCIKENKKITSRIRKMNMEIEKIVSRPGEQLLDRITGNALERAVKYGWINYKDAMKIISNEDNIIDWHNLMPTDSTAF